MSLLHDIRTARAPVAAFVAVGLFWGSFAALVPVLKPQAGLSDGGFGLAMLVAALGAVMAMWLAPLADARLGRRAMPVLALGMAAAFLVPGFATTGVVFALAMLGGAMMSGTLDVVMNARISEIEAQTRRPLMNFAHAMFSFAYAGAALLAGLLREAGAGPVLVFALMAGLACALCLVIAGDRTAGAVQGADEGTAAPRLDWALLLPGGLIILIAFLSEQATEGWSALHLERNLGAGAAEGALGPAILGLTMGIGRFSGQLVAARLPEALVIRFAALLSASGALVAAYAPSLAVAYAGFAVLGLGVSVVAPMAFGWVGRQVPARMRTLAISRISVLGYAGFFLGPPLMGFLAQGFGLYASFTAVALLLVIVPLVLVPWLARWRG